MIQFNLLPEVKLQYIRAERTRRLIFVISFIVTAVAIGILLLMLSASALQKKHLKDIDRDINSETSQLKGKPQIDRVLTVQNQLNSITGLHDGKPAATRLFGYLNQTTPNNVGVSSLQIDFAANTVTIAGATDALSSVNKYVDTLKFTTFKADKDSDAAPAFKDVVLTSFGLNGSSKPGQEASYGVSFTYDPILFDLTQKPTLTVPSITSTRSSVDQPSELFQETVKPAAKTGGN